MGKPGKPDIGHERNWASFDKGSSRRVENITTRESLYVGLLISSPKRFRRINVRREKGMEKKNCAAVTSETLFASRLSDDGYQFSSNRRSNVSRPRFVGLTFGIVLTAGALTNMRDDS